PAWARPQPSDSTLHVNRVRLRGVRIATRDIELQPFDGDVRLGPDGAVQTAAFTGGGVTVTLTPRDKGVRLQLQAQEWTPPVGPALPFSELAVDAVVENGQATFSSIEGKIGIAPVRAAGRAKWGAGSIRAEGEFSLTKGNLAEIMAVYTRDFSATGTVSVNGSYVLQGKTLPELFEAPVVEASFNVEQGVLNNVDIVRAIQYPS